MTKGLYLIQAFHTTGEVAYTVYANTAQQMQQEVLDALYDGFAVQVSNVPQVEL